MNTTHPHDNEHNLPSWQWTHLTLMTMNTTYRHDNEHNSPSYEGGLCFDRVQTSSVYTHHWCTYVFRVQMTLGLSVILQQKQVMLCSVVVCSSWCCPWRRQHRTMMEACQLVMALLTCLTATVRLIQTGIAFSFWELRWRLPCQCRLESSCPSSPLVRISFVTS